MITVGNIFTRTQEIDGIVYTQTMTVTKVGPKQTHFDNVTTWGNGKSTTESHWFKTVAGADVPPAFYSAEITADWTSAVDAGVVNSDQIDQIIVDAARESGDPLVAAMDDIVAAATDLWSGFVCYECGVEQYGSPAGRVTIGQFRKEFPVCEKCHGTAEAIRMDDALGAAIESGAIVIHSDAMFEYDGDAESWDRAMGRTSPDPDPFDASITYDGGMEFLKSGDQIIRGTDGAIRTVRTGGDRMVALMDDGYLLHIRDAVADRCRYRRGSSGI